MSEPRRRPTRLEIDRWLLGELSDAARAELESVLSSEEQARLRREDEALRTALLAQQSPAEFARHVRARTPVRRSATWVAAPALTAAVALVAALRSGPVEQPTAPRNAGEAPGERSKGLRPQIHVYRRTAHDVEELRDGATVHPHDLLQLGYVGAGRRYGVLISVDGNGAVTTHLPSSGGTAPALAQHGEQLLTSAYELDAAPRFERFFLVTADAPFDVAPILDAARTLPRGRAESEPLPLAPRFAQQSLRLRKELP